MIIQNSFLYILMNFGVNINYYSYFSTSCQRLSHLTHKLLISNFLFPKLSTNIEQNCKLHRLNLHLDSYFGELFDNVQISCYSNQLEINECQFINNFLEKGVGSSVYSYVPCKITNTLFFNCKARIGVISTESELDIQKCQFNHISTNRRAAVHTTNKENFILTNSYFATIFSENEAVSSFTTPESNFEDLNITNVYSLQSSVIISYSTTNTIKNILMNKCTAPQTPGIIFAKGSSINTISSSIFCDLNLNPQRTTGNSTIILLLANVRLTIQSSQFINLMTIYQDIFIVHPTSKMTCHRCLLPDFPLFNFSPDLIQLVNCITTKASPIEIIAPEFPSIASSRSIVVDVNQINVNQIAFSYIPFIFFFWGFIIFLSIITLVVQLCTTKKTSKTRLI